MRKDTWLLPLLLLIAATGAQESGSCDLACWLNQTALALPDQQYDTGPYFLGWFNISDMLCYGIELGGVLGSAPYNVPLGDGNFYPNSVDISVFGLATHCTGHWRCAIDEGNLTAAITDSALNFTLTLKKDSDGLAARANLTSCHANINITGMYFTGGMVAYQLNAMSGTMAPMFMQSTDNDICARLQALVEVNVTQLLMGINAIVRPYVVTPQPPPMELLVPPNTEVLTDNALVNSLDFLLDDLVGASGINNIVNRITNNTGALQFNLSFPFQMSLLGGMALLTVGIGQVTILGLNSWELLDWLEPTSAFTLSSDTRLSSLTLYIDCTFDTDIMAYPAPTLHEEATLVFILSGNDLQSVMEVALEAYRMKNYTDVMCTDIGCLLSLFDWDSTALLRLFWNISAANIAIIPKNGVLEQSVDATLNMVLALLTTSFEHYVPGSLNGFLLSSLVPLINAIIPMEASAYSKCVHANDIEEDGVDVAPAVAAFAAAGAFAVALAVVGIAATCVMRRLSLKHKEEVDKEVTAVREDSDKESSGSAEDPDKEETKTGVAHTVTGLFLTLYRGVATAPCLLLHPRINVVIRYLMPLLIVGNMALFVLSNTAGGTSVHININTGMGKVVSTPSLFTFDLASSVREMWKAGVWPLSLLIAVFSGAWPYLKLLMMLLSWTVPRRLLPVRYREYVLMFLDALGKWSLLDSYVMVLMLVAFHMDIKFPQHDPAHTTVDGEFSISIIVDPLVGFVTFLIATLISLVISHALIILHRFAESPSEREADKRGARFQSLCLHAFHLPTLPGKLGVRVKELCSSYLGGSFFRSRATALAAKVAAAIAVTLALLASVGLLGAGVSVTSYSFEFRGLVGWLLTALGEDTKHNYSVISTTTKMPDSTEHPDSFAVRLAQAVFIFTTLVTPICHMLLLLLLWLVPMSRRIQRYSYTVCEVFNAWAALEVFMVSLIAALMEIGQFVDFMVKDSCDGINALMTQYFSDVVSDDKCFDVVAKLRGGCWLMLAACIVYVITAVVVMRLCHRAIFERGKDSTETSEPAAANSASIDMSNKEDLEPEVPDQTVN
eukprot:TRINITY_DN161_c0_g3_i1.p1 TRINITY_DN161_c0_g3~~TRINITY_DN161_c0_g3_i1.p1  ORF type:complete len:1067 (-),score=233.61 TRINITY_DN161_c0_g3_i1:1526-4726(-)